MAVKICQECGNDIPILERICSCCGAQQSADMRLPSGTAPILDINIEMGMPLVAEALAKLEDKVFNAQSQGVRLVRVIHGYGASGRGGKIRPACHEKLALWVVQKKIRGFLPGTEYSNKTKTGKELQARFPKLLQSEHADSENRGITFVLL